MRIHFQIEYITRMGEDIRLQCDGWEKRMDTADGRLWSVGLDVDDNTTALTYRYAMYRDDVLVWTEWEAHPHRIATGCGQAELQVIDAWRPIPEDLPLYSTAYTDALQLDENAPQPVYSDYPYQVELRTTYPRLYPGERLAVMTSRNGWTEPLPMTHLCLHEWAVQVPADVAEYKFVIIHEPSGCMEWESGENRCLPQITASASTPSLSLVTTVPEPRIERPDWRVAGVVVPVFSLRSERSWGVGDFGDLKRMVGWVASVGMRALQTLPVNDTTSTYTYEDSYPYNAISVYALHPMYCDIEQLAESLPDKRAAGVDENAIHEMRVEAHMLNAMSQVDYVRVNHLKAKYLHLAYELDGARVLRTKAYKAFFAEVSHWLVPYAVFCHLRDKFGSPSPAEWSVLAKYNSEEAYALFAGKEKKQIQYYCYVQYVLHTQLLAVRTEAARLGVMLKGDIPIGVSRNSVDAWTSPSLFNLDISAGAPPDAFAADGQNWGFPTYNWDMMAKDGYEWWKQRFRNMARYFNAYRIDHVLGFFRIWQIPIDTKSGLLGQFAPSIPLYPDDFKNYGFRFEVERMAWPYVKETDRALFVRDHHDTKLFHPRIGALDSQAFSSLPDDQRGAYERLYNDYFYRRHNQFWADQAMSKLPQLTQCTRMLVCAEDLGMVPACVPAVMDSLRILSLEIQTMPKDEGREFADLTKNPVRSVATISTHDMPTMRGWWAEDHQRASRYWNTVLHHGGEAPRDMPAWLADDIVWRHLASPSMLCLISLQDWLATDDTLRHPDPQAERINIPANPRHYWRWRMHLSIEQLESSQSFCAHLRQIISAAGR